MRNAFAVFAALVITVFAGLTGIRIASAGFPVTPPSPNPCPSVGAAGCQPVWSPGGATPTPGPIYVQPASGTFYGAASSPKAFAIYEPGYTGTYTVSASPGGIASPSISANILTVAPQAIGTATVTVTGGAQSTPFPVIVATPTPTPGVSPLPSVSPGTVSFAGPGAAATTVAITETGYTGAFAASPTPTSVVSASVSGHTLTVYPVGSGTGSVGVSSTWGTGQSVSVTVNGPLAVSPTSAAFSGPTAAPTTAAITDPNYSGQYTVYSVAPTNVVTASISGSTLTVTPVNSGTATVVVTDGYNFSSFAATVAPTTPISVIQAVTCYGSTSPVTCSIATPRPGDKLDAICAGNPTGGTVAGMGVAQFNVDPTNNNYVVYSTIVGGTSVTSYAFPVSSGFDTGCEVVELRGVDQTLPTQVYGGDATFNTSTKIMQSVTAPFPTQGYVLGAFSPQLGTTSYTAGSATVTDSFTIDSEAVSASSSANHSDFLWTHKVEGGSPGNTAETATFPSLSLATGPQTYVAIVETPVGGTQPTPPPAGPISVSPSSIPFANNLASPVAVTVMDPYYTGAFSASPTPAGIVSASVNENSVAIAPVAVGTGSVTISDTLGNTASVSVSVSPTPTPAISPTPIATFAAPYSALGANPTTGPYAATFPTPKAVTVLAQIKTGPAIVPSGNTAVALPNSWYLEAGDFSSPSPNPGAGSGQHFYSATGDQSVPTGALSVNTNYVLIGTDDGTTIAYWYCTYPGATCINAPTSTTSAIPYSGGAGLIGAANATSPFTRLCNCDIWNVRFYNSALSSANISALVGSSAMVPDPYPSALPAPAYVNATPYGYPTPTIQSVTFPTSTTLTVAATVNCAASTSGTGSTIASLNGSWVVKAGLCNGSTNTSTNPETLQAYDQNNNKGAWPTTGLTAYPNGAAKIIAVFQGASGNILLYVCPASATPAWTCNAPTTVAETGNLALGTNPGYIGAGIDGINRPMQGDIWDFALYTSALTQTQVQTIAYASRVDPYPTPAPTSSATPPPTGTNYPGAGYPQWPNALSATATIAPSIAAGQVKSYDATTRAFYTNYFNTTFSGPQISGGVPGWGLNADWVTTNTGTNAGSYSDGLYITKSSDPTYSMYSSACSSFGCPEVVSTVNNVHIPTGAVVENYTKTCGDCHLQLVQPAHWVPCNGTCGSTTYPDVYPEYYEIDVFVAGTSQSCSTNGQSSQTCSLWNNPSTQGLYGQGIQIVSTKSYGWGQCCSANVERDFFHPSNSQPTNTGTGTSYAATYAFTSLVVTPWDIAQQAINHETGLYTVCNQDSQSDVWPSYSRLSDQYCSLEGGTNSEGWAYGDHIWLSRSLTQINSDATSCATVSGSNLCGSLGHLTPVQVIYAKSLATYGAVITDVGYSGGPVFIPVVKTSDADWSAVATQFGLPTSNNSGVNGYLLNLGLPMNYFLYYMRAINSCTFYPKPYTSSC